MGDVFILGHCNVRFFLWSLLCHCGFMVITVELGSCASVNGCVCMGI